MTVTYTLMLHGEEQDVDFEISADMVYEPAFVSGPMDACYPDCSECTITEIKVMSQIDGLKDADILDALETQVGEDKIIEDLWADYMLSSADAAADAADYYRDSREDR